MSETITLAEAAELAGITQAGVHYWIKKGWITPAPDTIMDRGRVLKLKVSKRELQDFLALRGKLMLLGRRLPKGAQIQKRRTSDAADM